MRLFIKAGVLAVGVGTVAVSTACQTHVIVLANSGAVAFQADYPTSPSMPMSPGSMAEMTEDKYDVGGTLAFQMKVGAGSTLEVGTNRPHTEYDVYNQVDPQAFFTEYSNASDWATGTSGSVTTYNSGGPTVPSFTGIGFKVPVASTPTEPVNSSWFTTQSDPLNVELPLYGLWRMDHGACSIGIPKTTIINTIISQTATQLAGSGFTNLVVQGAGYISHPNGVDPGSQNSGGIMINVSGIVPGGYIDGQDSEGLQFDFGFDDVHITTTVTIALDVNSEGILTSSMVGSPVTTSNCAQGQDTDTIFGADISLCEASTVSGKLTSGLSAIVSGLNAAVQPCQSIPVALPGQNPTACTRDSDCSGIGGLLAAELSGANTNDTINADDTVSGVAPGVLATEESTVKTAAKCLPAPPASCSAINGTASASISGNVCQITLGAKRANNFPDTVELSWFDDSDMVVETAAGPNTTAMALYTLSQTSSSFASIKNELCQTPSQGITNLDIQIRDTPACYVVVNNDTGVTEAPVCAPAGISLL